MKKASKIMTAAATAAMLVVICAAIALCALFPNKYAEEVNAAADEFGLDRALVRSVVWAESKFDRRATSKKGAVGLMQLMPETFEFCCNVLRIKDGNVYDPATNLRCGCYYLSVLADKFDGNVTAALVAYNAGEGHAQKFVNGGPAYPETQKYLKDISAAKRLYSLFDKAKL